MLVFTATSRRVPAISKCWNTSSGPSVRRYLFCFLFQAEDGIRDFTVTGVQTCALPIYVLLAAVDVGRVRAQDLAAPRLEDLLDLGRAPLQLAAHPPVVDVRSGLGEHDLLHPVASRPARGGPALEPDAPGRGSAQGDLLGERGEPVPGGLGLVALGLEALRVVPDQARSEEHTSELQSQSNLVCRLLLEKKKQMSSTTSSRSARAS